MTRLRFWVVHQSQNVVWLLKLWEKCENSMKKVITDLGYIEFFQCCLLSVRNESCFTLRNLKRPWGWERLRAGGEGGNNGWDGSMASPTRWTWVWVDSGSWWWTWRPGVLQFMGLQRVGHDWVTELNWAEALNMYRLNNHTKFAYEPFTCIG